MLAARDAKTKAWFDANVDVAKPAAQAGGGDATATGGGGGKGKKAP